MLNLNAAAADDDADDDYGYMIKRIMLMFMPKACLINFI